MASQQLEDQLVKHIDEALGMEKNVLRMLDGTIGTTDDEEIKSDLRHHTRPSSTPSCSSEWP